MRRMSACLLLAACAALAACRPEYQEVVVHECIMDGQDADYCRCQADGMKQALGVKRYAVFTDFILLGGTGKATRDDVLRLMDRHKMSPEDIAATQAAINEAMPLVHAYCNR
jgi:hypothetical protein